MAKPKSQNWPTLLNEGGWREVSAPLPEWSFYFKRHHGNRYTIRHNGNKLCWCLLVNGFQLATGDLGDMLLRADAIISGVVTT